LIEGYTDYRYYYQYYWSGVTSAVTDTQQIQASKKPATFIAGLISSNINFLKILVKVVFTT